MSIEVIPHTTRTLGVEQEIALIIEETMGITHEVIKDIETIIIIDETIIEVEVTKGNRSRSLDIQARGRRNDRSASNGRSRSGSRVSTNRDRIRCFDCREYNHFARKCLTRSEKRETEQIQQMFSLDDDQTLLQTPLIDMEDDIMTITPMETRDCLNL